MIVHATALAIAVVSGTGGCPFWSAACNAHLDLSEEAAFTAGRDAVRLLMDQPPVRVITCPRCKVLFDQALEVRG